VGSLRVIKQDISRGKSIVSRSYIDRPVEIGNEGFDIFSFLGDFQGSVFGIVEHE